MIENRTLLTYNAIVLGFVFILAPATLRIMARSVCSGINFAVEEYIKLVIAP